MDSQNGQSTHDTLARIACKPHFRETLINPILPWPVCDGCVSSQKTIDSEQFIVLQSLTMQIAEVEVFP